MVQSTRAECIGRLTAYVINMLSAVLGGGYAAGTAEASLREQVEEVAYGHTDGSFEPDLEVLCASCGALSGM